MKRKIDIIVDLKSKVYDPLILKQMDTTQIRATLLDDSMKINLESHTVDIIFTKPDGRIVQQESTVNDKENGITTIDLLPECLRQNGNAKIEIEIKNTDNEVISSFYIPVQIEKTSKENVNAENTPNYFEELEKAKEDFEKNSKDMLDKISAAEEKREKNETTRQTDESDRQTCENERQENEEQRKEYIEEVKNTIEDVKRTTPHDKAEGNRLVLLETTGSKFISFKVKGNTVQEELTTKKCGENGGINITVGNNESLEEKQEVIFPMEDGQVLEEGDYLADDGIHHLEEITPYSEEQQEAYNAIKNFTTYKDKTVVCSTDEVSPIFEVEYYLQNDVTKLREEVKEIDKELKDLLNGNVDLNNEILTNLSNNVKDITPHKFFMKMTAENISLEESHELQLPEGCKYKVGANCIDVYFCGELLQKGTSSDDEGHYYEVGEVDSISNKIKIAEDWATCEYGALKENDYFLFVVRGEWS